MGNAEVNDDRTLPPELKLGKLKKARDNGQAAKATKLAKPSLRTTSVTNEPTRKAKPTLNRNSPTRFAGRSGRDESTQA